MSEERQSEQKAWRKPELIVLVRSKPEEGVLAACKFPASGGSNDAAWNCATSVCSACFMDGAS